MFRTGFLLKVGHVVPEAYGKLIYFFKLCQYNVAPLDAKNGFKNYQMIPVREFTIKFVCSKIENTFKF